MLVRSSRITLAVCTVTRSRWLQRTLATVPAATTPSTTRVRAVFPAVVTFLALLWAGFNLRRAPAHHLSLPWSRRCYRRQSSRFRPPNVFYCLTVAALYTVMFVPKITYISHQEDAFQIDVPVGQSVMEGAVRNGI